MLMQGGLVYKNIRFDAQYTDHLLDQRYSLRTVKTAKNGSLNPPGLTRETGKAFNISLGITKFGCIKFRSQKR